MEEIRCFIAIELSPELKAELTRLQNKLKSAGGPNSAKWVDPNGIHLTLKFLGGVPADKIPEINRAIEEAARGIPRLKLAVTECGCFPNTRRPQVIWVGVTGDTPKLLELVKRLEESTAKLGFKPEGRPFTPHLTLARVRDTATPLERQTVGQAVEKLKVEIESDIDAESVCLMRSELTPRGAIYTRLSETKLGQDQ
jgi:RNA 2',3'-cyclic 3'-phosphodiesterase